LAGDCTANMRNLFTEMLLVDVVRGSHSTGAAVVLRNESKILVEKMAEPSQLLVGSEPYKTMINNIGIKAMIGHNRYATVGEKNVTNAHPFQFDNLVGAHNGTIDQYALKRLDDWKYFGTDSEAIYNSVSIHGLKPTIEQLSGAWALTWYDKETNTINFLRNSKRPLYYCYNKARTTIFWASESGLLDWILTRNHIDFDKSIFLCEEDQHYRWELPETINDKLPKPICTEVKERVFKYTPRFSEWDSENWYKDDKTGVLRYRGGHDNRESGGNYTGPPPFKPQTAEVTPQTKVDTSKFRPPYKDSLGRVINKLAFEDLVSCGCVFCDKTEIIWTDFIYPLPNDLEGRKVFMCEECYNNDDTRKLIEYAIA
jgi:hypothetical protein